MRVVAGHQSIKRDMSSLEQLLAEHKPFVLNSDTDLELVSVLLWYKSTREPESRNSILFKNVHNGICRRSATETVVLFL